MAMRRVLLTLLLVFAPAAASAGLPAISVQSPPDGHAFFVTETGQRFVPQGVNWVVVSPGTIRTSQNISFNRDYYPAHEAEIRASLREIASLGFNTVRVRLDAGAIAGPRDRVELDPAYMRDLVDFIRQAGSDGLYVELTGQWLPGNYYQLAPGSDRETSGVNALLLNDGLIRAYGRYIADVLSGIRKADPQLLSTVFSVDLWFESNALPFSRDAGSFPAASGRMVDLADPMARQAFVDDATVHWINGVIAVARPVAPHMLFTASVFSPLAVNRAGYGGVYTRDARWGDPRQPFRLAAIARSDADFLEIHPYPHAAHASVEGDLASMEVGRLPGRKPILVGETGASKIEIPDAGQAAQTMQSVLREACAQGFAGWAYWTWNADEQKDLWNLAENNGFLAKRLSPKTFDWCPGD